MGMIELSGVLGEGTTMLANMPMFHGFGLCTCVHLPVCIGLRIILVPTFTLESLADIITKKQVNYLAGVPTLFEKLFVDEYLRNKDLSFIKGIFCGGDSISIDSKARIDKFLKDHGCGTFIRLGYGCTECLTATAITPKFEERPGSVGVPIPGFAFKIADVETAAEVPDGETGEICINGPSVMMEYYNNPEETAMTLKTHDDGKVWLHTGDVGTIKDGFIYFTNRIKRIIITSGYNVYPSQIEHVLNQHPYVDSSCVIGVPDPLRGTKVKAVLVLKPGIEQSDEVMDSISQYVKETTSAYAKPREYEVVDSLPRTKLGKVDYRALEAKECGTEDQKQ
jgi:long-chain acyl-CoA synthetase